MVLPVRRRNVQGEKWSVSGLEDLPEDEDQLPAEYSEDALATAWVGKHHKDWRYVAPWGAWFEWVGDRWKQDTQIRHFELARQVTRDALAWPPGLKPNEARRISSSRTSGSLLQFVKSDPKVAATVDQWDAGPMLLGVPGGVIDLTIGKVIEAERGQFITKQTAVAPAEGRPEKWLEFLNRVTDEDEAIITYLQRFSGYALTGSTQEHALAFLYGTGANGKTTFLQTLLGIMGDYALTTGMETLAESHSERHTTEIARLRGARLVAAEETSTGSRWNEGRIKRLTGGGRVAARFMRQDDFEFEPQFKLLIAGNHKPSLRADEAMKRRIHLVPFTVTIPEADRDKDLPEKLKQEWPQIFAWMLRGCMAWGEYGLAPGEKIKAASERYIESNDMLGAWLEERTEHIEKDELTEGKTLYADFARWCEEQGETVWKRRGWSDAMIDRGFNDGRKRIGGILTRGFFGVKLRLSVSQNQRDDYYEKQ